MNIETIRKMAIESGLCDPDLSRHYGQLITDYGDSTEAVFKFASMVAAAEREACAKVCEDIHGPLCDVGMECAADIRARSGK
jgi:hypothetical protein